MNRRTIVTERLALQPIASRDADALSVLHGDARVMSHLKHGVLARPESDAMVRAYEAEWQASGIGAWTARTRDTDELIGLGGWRREPDGVALRLALATAAQGRGYGIELGRAAIAYAFDVAGLGRVVAFTRKTNLASQRTLEKIGMRLEREWAADGGHVLMRYAAERG